MNPFVPVCIVSVEVGERQLCVESGRFLIAIELSTLSGGTVKSYFIFYLRPGRGTVSHTGRDTNSNPISV